MELKQIPINKILANFTQPREEFNKEKIKELSESILSNGLINPITVRTWKGGRYMIVAGERRWRAHNLANIKTIPAFVKEYKSDIDWQVESLVENWQREDLTSIEKENNVYSLWNTNKFNSHNELAKKLGASREYILALIRIKEDRERLGVKSGISTKTLRVTEGLDDKDRKKLIKNVEKGIVKVDDVEKVARTIKKAPIEVKEALLSDEVTTEQAEDLSNIQSETARKKALKETKSYGKMAKAVPKMVAGGNETAKLSEAVKKKFETAQRIIFENLWQARTGLIMANKNLGKANQLLGGLLARSFESALDKKTVVSSLRQLKQIDDEISKFSLQTNAFDNLKKEFVERVEVENKYD